MFWRKIKEFIVRNWIWLLSLLALLLLLVRQSFVVTQHKGVLKNEIETNEKIAKIKKIFDEKIAQAEIAALLAHNDRELEIKKREIRELKDAKTAAVKRENENSSVSGDELAKRAGETFGAEVVEMHHVNDSD